MTRPDFTHPRLAEIVPYIESRRAALLAEAGRIAEADWHTRPAEGSWTPGELMEHLRVVEQSVGRLAAKLIADGVAAGLEREDSTTSVLSNATALRSAERVARIEAPERVAPRTSPARADVLAGLAATRAALLDAVAPGDGLALGRLRWPHQVLGELDLYQWLIFVGAHEERHTAQLREMAAQLAMRG